MKAAKRLLLLFGIMLCAGAAFAQTTYTVALAWKIDATPACSSTVKTFCVIGRTLTDVTNPANPVVIAGPTVITPAMTSYTTPAASYTAPVTKLYAMVTNYVDGLGATQSTGNATCGTAGTAGPCGVSIFFVLPPSNLTATPVQVSALVEPSGESAGMM